MKLSFPFSLEMKYFFPTYNKSRREIIHYQIKGSGRSLVFLHGWGMNLSMMEPLVSKLSHDYTCISVDLFGFGKSEEIENYENFDQYVQKLHEFLLSLQIEKPILIAHSFGVRIAILYALHYPTGPLILTGGAGIRKPLSFKKRIRQFLYKKGFAFKGSYDYERASGFLRKVLVEVVSQDLREPMKKISVPVLLIWGEKDQETPLWMGKKMKKLIPCSELIVFQNEDHFAYYHESGRFCFIVREFLQGVDV